MTQEGPLKKQKLFENVHEDFAKDMAEPEERDYMSSPDMFANSSSPRPEFSNDNDHQPNHVVIQIENDAEINERVTNSAVLKAQTVNWKGVSLEELMGGCEESQLPLIKPSEFHRVLFRLPITSGEVPQAYPSVTENGVEDLWDSFHVRMPFSPQSQYVVQNASGEERIESRWTIIKKAFSERITSSEGLAEAILSYNSKYIRKWDFNALHYFFNDELTDEEREQLVSRVLPSIVSLALLLPELVTAPIPLLRRHRSRSLSMSQLQAAALLANAFLCTFPRRNAAGKNAEYAAFPDVNFNRLFCCGAAGKPPQRNVEKLKCVFNYFRRVADKYPVGVLTFARRHVDKSALPRWDRLQAQLPALHVASAGTIEDQGAGMLQADFANSFVGGGVLGSGCVQEEIRFVICPELIVSRLFTEELDATEALLVTGCERFSDYAGYADTFAWTGDFVDRTPADGSGRRLCQVVAIDALYLRNPDAQFAPKCMLREVNKAFVGCCDPHAKHRLCPFATGNWGCGAFRGDASLKALLQLMAAAAAQRNVAYFTFGDHQLRDSIHAVHAFLVEQQVTVARLWGLLSAYHRTFRDGKPTSELYSFLYEAVLNGTQIDKVREKPTTSGFQNSSHKSSRHETSRNSRVLDDSASTSHQIEPEDLERALEESLREQTFLREIMPQMDDATREAKLALIESSGKLSAAAENLYEDSTSHSEPKSAFQICKDSVGGRIIGLTDCFVENSPDCAGVDDSPDLFASLLLDSAQEVEASQSVAENSGHIGQASTGCTAKRDESETGSSSNSSSKNRDRKAEIKCIEPDNRSPVPKQKITDYFSTNSRYK